MKVSVVMPVFIFTAPQVFFFTEAVESILNQTYQDLELIIVDDGSQMDYEVPKDDRIRYFKIEHGGIAKARNYGISQMTGDFYTAQDADDVSNPERLKLMIKAIEKNSADAVYSDFYVCSMDKNDLNIRKTGEFNLERLKKEQHIPYFLMVRREKLVKYRDKYTANDDWMFIFDLYQNGVKFCYIKKPLLIYRRNPMSVSARSIYDGRKIRELKWIKNDIKKLSL